MGRWSPPRPEAHPTAVLGLYGFLANFRPAEPFLTPYLMGPHKNLSAAVVTNYLFPIWTYSYLALLPPVFLLADALRHKPLLLLQGLFLVTNAVLLCFFAALPAMVLLQVNFAVVTSTEVAYFSYIYSVIPERRYQRATGYLRGAMLAGYTCGAGLGQVLVSLAGLDYFYLNAITLGTASAACLTAPWLPTPPRSRFFSGVRDHRDRRDRQAGPEEPQVEKDGAGQETAPPGGGGCSRALVATAGSLLWQNLRESYSSRTLVCWSLWWSLATAGYVQVFNYVQLMWDHVEPSATSAVYNGGVEAVSSLVGAVAAFSAGRLQVRWSVWGELTLGALSAVAAAAVFLMALGGDVWLCYAAYVLFKACYMFLITVTTFQIAALLPGEAYALTFGVNTFVALCLQTAMTLLLVDAAVLGLDIETQFLVYGSYYAAIALLFLLRGARTAWLQLPGAPEPGATEEEAREEEARGERF